MYNPFSLEGKKIFVTGASSGIGRATAIECSKMGASLIINGRDEERLKGTLARLDVREHSMFVGDLTVEDTLKRLLDELPVLDGVFFCAGVTDTTLVKFIDEKKIDRVFNINLTSPILLTKGLLKKKKIREDASLVYMSSMGAENIAMGLGIYAASKNALNAFVRTLALELANRQIRANVIMPSMVKTELIDTLTSFSKDDLERDEAKYPLGYGRPEDIAYAAIYLLSDASRWITGSSIRMDGGSTLA